MKIKLFEEFEISVIEMVNDIISDISDDGIYCKVSTNEKRYGHKYILIKIGNEYDPYKDLPIYKYTDTILTLNSYLTDNDYNLDYIEYYSKPDDIDINNWINNSPKKKWTRNIKSFIKKIENKDNFKFIFILYEKKNQK
jgi:hypothetical protein